MRVQINTDRDISNQQSISANLIETDSNGKWNYIEIDNGRNVYYSDAMRVAPNGAILVVDPSISRRRSDNIRGYIVRGEGQGEDVAEEIAIAERQENDDAQENDMAQAQYEMVNDSYGNLAGETDTAENWIEQINALCEEMGWDAPQLRELADGTYVNADGETTLSPVTEWQTE